MSKNNTTILSKKLLLVISDFLRKSTVKVEFNPAIQTSSGTIGLENGFSEPQVNKQLRSMVQADIGLDRCTAPSVVSDLAVETDKTLAPEWVRSAKKQQPKFLPDLHPPTENPQQGEPKKPVTQRAAKARLLDVLVTDHIIDKATAQKAVELQKESNGKRRLIDILIEDLNADMELVLEKVAEYYSFEFVDPSPFFGDKDRLQAIQRMLQVLSKSQYDTAVKLRVLPFDFYRNGVYKLTIISPDPTHPDINGIIRAFGVSKYEIRYVSVIHWKELWRQLAFDQGAKQIGLDVGEEFTQVNREDYEAQLEHELEEEVGRGKLGELIESIMVDGVRTGASDIHVIPKGIHRTEFHFRIDGKLILWSVTKDVRAEAILSVTKDRGKNLDRFEKFSSQDGYAQRTIDNKVIRFRFSTMPIYGSDMQGKLESIVIRILRGAETATGVESLGMHPDSFTTFNKAIRKPQGMVVFTGPTGSGKSTSQVAAINTIIDPSINILTIEDPVEYLIEGCRQIKLNHKLDFEGALRGLLRHDPDVIMVGEMRDRSTADLAVKLANTGHLIFSTLHTNDAASAITRLYNMGIEPFLLAYTINIVVAQRLVRKLCDRCKMIDTHIDEEHLMEYGLSHDEISKMTFYKPVGCVHCVKGFRGRVGIFEVLNMTKEIRKVILKSKDFINEDDIRTLAIQNGMKTLRHSALQLVKEGITSIDTVAGMAIED